MKYRQSLQALQNNLEGNIEMASNIRDRVPTDHKEYFNQLKMVLNQGVALLSQLDNKLTEGLAKMEL